ncbi:MAG: hypothetical protein OXC37_05800, partial [Bdellovibrionaceae bacterium]|nr:hypothetical protein [Pseudobdellovibrionaceae bacterium]
CQAPCTAPKTKWDGTQCVCPDNTYGANCITCTGGKVWNNNQCVCPTDKPWFHNNTCKACPANQPQYKPSTNTCESVTNTNPNPSGCRATSIRGIGGGSCVLKATPHGEVVYGRCITKGGCRYKCHNGTWREYHVQNHCYTGSGP